MTYFKLQKEINAIAKLNMISGELYIALEVKAKSYNELNVISEYIIDNIQAPTGFNKEDNMIYNDKVKIYISFTKIN
jgi:hypothetical protein